MYSPYQESTAALTISYVLVVGDYTRKSGDIHNSNHDNDNDNDNDIAIAIATAKCSSG